MTAVKKLTVKRETNRSLKRTADNMIVMTIRLRKDRSEALRKAQRSMEHTLSQGALMDRAIDLLIADMKAKGEMK